MLAHADPERAKLLLDTRAGRRRRTLALYCHLASVYAPQAVADGSVNGGGRAMADLRTNYMGIDLRNPLVASPSPMSEHIDKLRALEDAGIGAVVMYSLFEEQIELEQHHLDLHLSHAEDSYHEALSYFPELDPLPPRPGALPRPPAQA
jgi:hypothetical protein